MSAGLPSMAYSDGITKRKSVKFGGYNHNLSAGDGQLWDMQNLTSDFAPLLASRRPRYLTRTLDKPNGLYANDGLYWADGTGFYADGELKGAVSDTLKTFAGLGAYIIIMPDKKYYNKLDGSFGPLESQWSGSGYFRDGTIYGEAAEANTIYSAGAVWENYFNVGDAVKITGGANDTTIIIREIEGSELRFYENSFVVSGTAVSIELKRSVPDLEFICSNENRLWGCKGDTIYASKLGDIFNWNVFDGLSTDSYAVDVGSAGDFTACFSYLGYPCFFKEEYIYKVYGSKPSNFEVMGSASLGVEKGSERSLAVAGEILFYLSRSGIAAYSGGIPQSVSADFGTQRYRNAVAGSNGTKYYVSMQDAGGAYAFFAFDTRTKLWHKEDDLKAVGFGWNEELYFLDAGGNLWLNGDVRFAPDGAQAEAAVLSFAEFGDFTEGEPNKKGTGKLQLRLELDEGAALTVYMQFDSDGQWQEVKTLETNVKRSYYLPIIPRRSDHYRIRLCGQGAWRLYSLTRENYIGSEL